MFERACGLPACLDTGTDGDGTESSDTSWRHARELLCGPSASQRLGRELTANIQSAIPKGSAATLWMSGQVDI